MSKHILLTGGTGLVGKALTKLFIDKGYSVSHLSRRPGTNAQVATYLWDVSKAQIDDHCIDGVDTIVHLAGSGIAESRWTDKRKQEIVESRTRSIQLVYDLLKKKPHNVTSVVSASAIGYYSDRGDELMTEDSLPANDFMGRCCQAWEQAVDEGKQLGLRIVKFRTGVVLNANDGALPKMSAPVKFGVGAVLGSGKQWIPWIHEQDVIDMYNFAVEQNDLTGIFNMAAPEPVTNQQFTKDIAHILHRPLWLPNVPAFALKLALGEMSTIVLGSTKTSADKIMDAGFEFSYPTLPEALKDLFKK